MKVFYWKQSVIRSVAKTNNTTKCASTQEKESNICVQMWHSNQTLSFFFIHVQFYY